MHIDVTALIVAITGLVTVLGNLGLGVAIFVRQGSAKTKATARDAKLHEIGQAVDGLSDKRAASAEALGFAHGEKVGGEAERAR